MNTVHLSCNIRIKSILCTYCNIHNHAKTLVTLNPLIQSVLIRTISSLTMGISSCMNPVKQYTVIGLYLRCYFQNRKSLALKLLMI